MIPKVNSASVFFLKSSLEVLSQELSIPFNKIFVPSCYRFLELFNVANCLSFQILST